MQPASLPASPLQSTKSASKGETAATRCTDGSNLASRNAAGGSVPFVSGQLEAPLTSSKSNRSNSYQPGGPSVFRNSPLNIINKNFNMNRLNFINNRAFVSTTAAKSPRTPPAPRPVVRNLNYVATTTASGEKRLQVIEPACVKVDDRCKVSVQATQQDDESELQPSQQTTETEDDDDNSTQKENERILFQPETTTPGAFPLSPSLSSSTNSNGTKILFEKLLIERLKSTSSSTMATGVQKTWSAVSISNRKVTARPPAGSLSGVAAASSLVASTSTTSSSGVEYLVGSASSSSSINNDDESSSGLKRHPHPVPVSTSQQTITSRARTGIPSSASGNISEKMSSVKPQPETSHSARIIKPSATSTSVGSRGGSRENRLDPPLVGSTSKSSSSTNLYTPNPKNAEPSRSRPKCLYDENEYRMDHPKRGIALIINNKHFASHLGMPTRDGTDKDASNLEVTLSRLGFDIKVVSNRTAASMKDILLQLARYDHSDSDCFLCVIMSHGEDGFVYGIDREINVDELIRPFQHNKTLVGKPKLFFIQACRGSQFMDPIGLVDSNPFDTNEQCVAKIPMQADFLIAYSTISGYYSWRNSANGSWFIQALCEIFNKHAHEHDLLKLLTLVNRKVAYFFKSNTDDPYMNNKRQIPCVLSMLTKDVYFKPRSRLSARFIK